jgi:hypothetical protein
VIQRDWDGPVCSNRGGPIVRTIVFIACALVFVGAFAQLQNESTKGSTTDAARTAKKGNTKQAPIVVNVLPTPKTQEETKREQDERKEKAELDRKLVDINDDLARYTSRVATFTAVLALIGVLQLLVFGYQSRQLKRTVDFTESSNAPYVFPVLSDIAVRGADPVFTVQLINHGKTPALTREERYELYVAQEPPTSGKFSEHAHVVRTTHVIGAEKASEFPYHFKFDRRLTQSEMGQAARGVNQPPFVRFYLVGYIVYDDFFGYTHTVGFSFKLFRSGEYRIKHYAPYVYNRKEKTSESKRDEAGDDEANRTEL